MRWRRGRMDDDDAMAMVGQRQAERSLAIRGNNQLMSTVWGGVDESEGQFRGGATEKGRGGGD
jgi:hypothetical protein